VTADIIVAMQKAGKTTLRQPCLLPPPGNQPSCSEKTKSNMSPSQKFGIDIPMMLTEVVRLSASFPARFAAKIPIGIEISAPKKKATKHSCSVAGNLLIYTDQTLCRVTFDVPKSPWIKLNI